MSDTQSAAPTIEASLTLLFVDDESNILSSLKRLFRQFGYRIFTAESGALGLQILEKEAVDLVISDMRMPEMNGAQFLEKVREKWPQTVRILLTGYAEVDATIDAINKGQIYRYVSKPWDDTEIVTTVKQALEQKILAREKQRLEELTRRQNEELKDFNANLEAKVKARTEEVSQTMKFLEVAHEKVKKSFITSVRVFSNLIEMRDSSMTGHSRRVADMARVLAQQVGMSDAELQDVFIAGLLLDIGKIGLPDRLLSKSFVNLTADERAEVVKYPAKGQMALMALEQLQGAALLIRSHRERFDGTGFPDGLSGLNIPLGSRVLALVKDLDLAMLGTATTKGLKHADALLLMQDSRGKRYDPTVVEAALKMNLGGEVGVAQARPELALRSSQLKGGMALSRDLVTRSGGMLLSKDHVLSDHLIGQIRHFEKIGEQLTIHVFA